MNYYCFIAGMPDLQPENTKDVPQLDDLLNELHEVLSDSDRHLLDYLQFEYDNTNLLAFLKDKEDAKLSPLGTLSLDNLISITAEMDELDKPNDKILPPYFIPFYHSITDEKAETPAGLEADFLTSLYFDYGVNCHNKFLADWFKFCLDLNNILTAYSCRKHKVDSQNLIIGDNEVANCLRQSNARDFGLTGIVDSLEVITAIAEDPNLLTRERRIDALKWNWLEEHTFFNYFSIERILAFFIRCQLLQRWNGLSTEHGKEVFQTLLHEMEQQVTFE